MDLFKQILSIDSTLGKERELALFLYDRLEAPLKELQEVGDGTLNLLLKWSESPSFVFCSHMDTVPPYIPPVFSEAEVSGRGSCDAKGQFYAMYKACKRLEAAGENDFALLILAGEETGSYGAKAFAKTSFRAKYLLVGEPTDNCMICASKGTKSYDLRFTGRAFHSGYPENGESAVEAFVDFCNRLRNTEFPSDPVLGKVTYNIGLLHSANPQNILSPELTCRLYFRTTFAADACVGDFMCSASDGRLTVTERGGDVPAHYHTVDGLSCKTAAFGSDAPHLTNFEVKMICGPGSILCAHRDDERLEIAEFNKAVDNYIKIYESCN